MLKVEAAEVHGILVLQCAGVIEENDPFGGRVPEVSRRMILIDAAGIERLTSFGVAGLVGWARNAELRGNQLWWARVSTSLLAQVRMVRKVLGERASVVSVMAPFYCDDCDAESSHLVELEGFGARGRLVPPPCPSCGNPQEFDEVEGQFHALLSGMEPKAVPPHIRGLVRLFDRKSHGG